MPPSFVYHPTVVMFEDKDTIIECCDEEFVADLNLHIFPKDIRSCLTVVLSRWTVMMMMDESQDCCYNCN